MNCRATIQNAALVWHQVVSKFAKTPYAAEAAQRLERLNAKLAAPMPKVPRRRPRSLRRHPRLLRQRSKPFSRAETQGCQTGQSRLRRDTLQDVCAAPSANVPAVHLTDATPHAPLASPAPLPTSPSSARRRTDFRTLTETEPLR